MNKKALRTIISLFIVILLSTQSVAPSTASAAPLNWDNPNVGSTPFKPRARDFINPELLMSVVGCTGVVNKVAASVLKVTSDLTTSLVGTVKEKAIKEFIKQCRLGKKSAEAAAAATSSMALGTGTPVGKQVAETLNNTQCPNETLSTKDTAAVAAAQQKQQIEQCFTGIAVTLAKNQLTSMTKATFNWVNTGFNGDPFFVTNMQALVDDLQQNVLNTELNLLKGKCVQRAPITSTFDPKTHAFTDTTPRDKDGSVKCLQYKNDDIANNYPYGADFARTAIKSYQSQRNINDSLKQDLTNFLPQGATVDSYAKDFAQGGWNAWLALTQHPQNNPLGYNMIKSQDIVDQQVKVVAQKEAEVNRNSGYQDQTICADKNNGTTIEKCKMTKVITPGSAIRDKVSTYINSPERQLELAKTINDSLNAVFTALLGKLFDGGIVGLSSVKDTNYTDITNLSYDKSGGLQITGTSSAPQGGTYNGSTTSLGNKYTEAIDGGTWDAKNNVPQLSAVDGPRNQFYTVSTAGNTKLTANAHNWKVGEKAFFDGTTWHVGVPKYVIESRGGLQIQYDFNDTSKQILKVLPQVIPKLGELDYCIPGPNQNWESNSSEIKDAFSNYIDAFYTKSGERKVCDFLCITKHTVTYPVLSIPSPAQYKSFFDKWPDIWAKVSKSELFTTAIVNFNNGGSEGTWQPWWQINPDTIDAEKDYIQKSVEALEKEYATKINDLYGPRGIMQSEVLEDANGNVYPNSGYLPMATTGLNMTRNIVQDAQDNDISIKEYQDGIVQTNSNLYKLTVIKDQINAIVEAAQKRRVAERKANGLPPIKQICLDNEKITYVQDDVLK